MESKLVLGDCIEKLKELDDCSVEAIITDPPYELNFMNKKWDNTGIAYNVDMWKECLRVLKPGGHLLSFGGTRTYHRMACAIEDAGFEIRDMLEWVYSSGFPKNMNIGKAYDKVMGNEKKVFPNPLIKKQTGQEQTASMGAKKATLTVSKGSSSYKGLGTALKPSHEPIILARKPLSEKTIVENVIKYDTGGLDIDKCRLPISKPIIRNLAYSNTEEYDKNKLTEWNIQKYRKENYINTEGRFPANVLVTDNALGDNSVYFDIDAWNEKNGLLQFSKAGKKEKNNGCEELELKQITGGGGLTAEKNEFGVYNTASAGGKYGSIKALKHNHHPTVKPLALIKYLVTLISREGQTVIDPFMGSGTTGIACKLLNRNFIGIELNEEYIKIAKARINYY